MVGLNAGVNPLGELVVGEAAHVKGIGLRKIQSVEPQVQVVLQAEGEGNGCFHLVYIQQVAAEDIQSELLKTAVEALGNFFYLAGEDAL